MQFATALLDRYSASQVTVRSKSLVKLLPGYAHGTAAVTTRGFNTADMDVVAQAISLVIDDMEKNKEEAMALVKSLTDKYPLYE